MIAHDSRLLDCKRYCNGKKLLKEFNSVAVKFPDLAARWSDKNEQKADEVLPSVKASYIILIVLNLVKDTPLRYAI